MKENRSKAERALWAQFDALEMGSGWEEEDIVKPQVLVEDVYGDSHPGSVHLNGLSQAAAGASSSTAAFPPTTTSRTYATAAPRATAA